MNFTVNFCFEHWCVLCRCVLNRAQKNRLHVLLALFDTVLRVVKISIFALNRQTARRLSIGISSECCEDTMRTDELFALFVGISVMEKRDWIRR